MIRYFSILIVTLTLLSVTSFAQSSKYVQHKMDKAPRIVIGFDDQPSFYSDFKSRQLAINRSQRGPNAAPVDLIVENYDWLSNSYTPPQLYAYDFTGDGVFDPFGITTGNTLLQAPPSTFGRYAVLGFIDDFGVATYLPYGFTGTGAPVRTGWNSHLFYDEANPDGKIYLAIYDFLDADAKIDDHVWEVDLLTDPTTATQLTNSTTALHGGWARFALDGNGTFWELVDNSSAVPLNIAISTDGATFTVVDSLGSNDPTFWGTGFGNDPIIMASGNKIAVMNNVAKLGSLAKLGLGIRGTTDPDSASGTYLWYSTDGGNAWQGDWILLEGDNVITNRPNYEPLFQNYDIGSHTVDAQGVVHVVQSGVNSVGLVGTDTLNVYPLLYWNDRDKDWMSLELPAVETAAYTSALTWGNVIGAGRPVVKADASGNVVVVMWNRAQFEGEPGNSAINTYPGPTTPYYNYDVVYAYSTNGGVTFSTPEIIGRSLGNSYMYPNIGGIQIANGEATVHYTYYWDKIPGSFVLSQNAKSVDNVLVYNTVSFPYTPTADIPVTFNVDMGVQAFEGNFPAGANVVVRGSFQADFGDPGGNWQGNLYQLSDADGDTIYTGTFNAPVSLAGNNYAFKYVIVNPPAGDNWESTPDRPFTVTAPATNLPTVCFNDDCIPTILNEVTNTINFTADISGILGVGVGGAFDPNQDSLTVQGLDWDNLGKNVVGNRRMVNNDPFNSGIYTTTLTFTSGSAAPNGVGDSTKWKFRAFPDTRFANTGWETGTDRWHFYVANGSVIDLPVIVPRIYPLFGPLVNDVPVQFTVDMTGAVNKWNGLPIPLAEIQFVGIKGAAPFLGSWGGNWTVADTIGGSASTLKVLHNIGGNLWRYNVVAPAGTNSGAYEYKYAAMYPGADTVNGGSTPLDNEGAFGQNHLLLLSDQPSISLWNIFGDFTTDVKEIGDFTPIAYDLGQNYPNPFNPSTSIKFSIPEAGLVTLKVFNLLGQEVATLVNSEKTSGVYEATFDASSISSGIYFYTLEAKNFTSTKKMVLLK